MRRTSKCVKFADKRTGWYGEGCWRPAGRRFLKRLEHRHNRHVARKVVYKETDEWTKE